MNHQQYPASRQSWYMVVILFLAYTCAVVDQRVLTLLVGPLKADLGLSDTQFSIIAGLAFAVTYGIAGLPVSRLADRKSRRTIIAIGITVWSLMTVITGLAKNFTQLFITRMGVGLGEASLTPAAHSLISDSFKPEKRAMAFSVYHMGYPVGSGVALIIGGVVIETLSRHGAIEIAWLGTLQPWQQTFIIVGFPGLLIAALMFTFTEPKRQNLLQLEGGKQQSIPLKELFAFIKERRAAYFAHLVSVAILGLLAIGTMIWYPAFLKRIYNLGDAQIGFSLGIIVLVCGVAGLTTGGWLAEKIRSKGHFDANMRVMLIATLTKILPLAVAPLMPTATGALALIALGTYLGQIAAGVSSAALQEITPNQMRAQMSAILLFLVNIFGIAGGAIMIALITDYVFGDEMMIHYSISLATVVVAPIAALIMWRGLPAFRKAAEEANSWE